MAELPPIIVFHCRHFVRHLGICNPICVKLLQVKCTNVYVSRDWITVTETANKTNERFNATSDADGHTKLEECFETVNHEQT